MPAAITPRHRAAAHGFEGMPEVDGCCWSEFSANFVLRLLRIARHPASSMTARAALLLAVAMASLSTQTVSAQCGPDQSRPYATPQVKRHVRRAERAGAQRAAGLERAAVGALHISVASCHRQQACAARSVR